MDKYVLDDPNYRSPEKLKMPVCPYCAAEMEPFNYHGYYDAFVYWGCDCSNFPKATEHRGEYA